MKHALVFALLVAGAGCADPVAPPVPPPPPKGPIASIILAPSGVTLAVNDSILVQVVENSIGETSWAWSSGSTAIATVSAAGWVRGARPGDVAILACGITRVGFCGSAVVHVR